MGTGLLLINIGQDGCGNMDECPIPGSTTFSVTPPASEGGNGGTS